MNSESDDQGQIKEITEVMRRGIEIAIKENQQKGIPSPFLKDGRIAYIMPDGSTKFKDDLVNGA